MAGPHRVETRALNYLINNRAEKWLLALLEVQEASKYVVNAPAKGLLSLQNGPSFPQRTAIYMARSIWHRHWDRSRLNRGAVCTI